MALVQEGQQHVGPAAGGPLAVGDERAAGFGTPPQAVHVTSASAPASSPSPRPEGQPAGRTDFFLAQVVTEKDRVVGECRRGGPPDKFK